MRTAMNLLLSVSFRSPAIMCKIQELSCDRQQGETLRTWLICFQDVFSYTHQIHAAIDDETSIAYGPDIRKVLHTGGYIILPFHRYLP
ncbi:hypothetical protein F4775DRAFT_537782, partial [Biscogniauxia sp. FL1348]